MPYKNGNKVWNETEWSEEMIRFLKDNHLTMTNKQLAGHLNLRLTVTRNKLKELGLKKMELEYWSDEMIQFLKDSYKKIGDVEIMEFFMKVYPKVKGWKRGAIWKKRKQMGLIRSEIEKSVIEKRHNQPGGRRFTIHRNSSSKNLHASWVVQMIAWRNKELWPELMKDKKLIASARALILLKRAIKKNESTKTI